MSVSAISHRTNSCCYTFLLLDAAHRPRPQSVAYSETGASLTSRQLMYSRRFVVVAVSLGARKITVSCAVAVRRGADFSDVAVALSPDSSRTLC